MLEEGRICPDRFRDTGEENRKGDGAENADE